MKPWRWLGRPARCLFSTWSLRGRLPDGTEISPRDYPFGRQIFALCERDAFALAAVIVDRGFTVLAAFGRDGDFASATLEGIGCRVVRGAAGRGGVRALRRLLSEIRAAETPVGIVVDGPLGPTARPKKGILVCARESGRPIVPLGAAARVRFEIRRSWSGIYFPAPFTALRVVAGESMFVPREARAAQLELLAAELGRRLVAARHDAVRWIETAAGIAPLSDSARGAAGSETA